MACTRQMPTKAEMEARNKRADKCVKWMVEENMKQAKKNAKLKAKTTRHSWEMQALQEI